MVKSSKAKVLHEKQSSPQSQQGDDCGREGETTSTDPTVRANAKGGSGHRGGKDHDHKKSRPRSRRPRKDDGGRGAEKTEVGSTVVADTKGGTGQHEGGPYGPK